MKKNRWNQVTPFSKGLALVLFVTLPFFGFWLGAGYGEAVGLGNVETGATTAPTVSTPSSLPQYYQKVAEWQTEENTSAKGGFKIAYPIDFPTESDDALFSLTIPKAFDPQTNFDEAVLTVNADASQSAIANCLVSNISGGPTVATSTAWFNGVSFTVFHSEGVGAGNYYETTSYRTLHAGECYTIQYVIHSSQIMNYPSSYHLHPFDETKVASVLDRIVGTFVFI